MHSYPTRLITVSALLEFTFQRQMRPGRPFPGWESWESGGPQRQHGLLGGLLARSWQSLSSNPCIWATANKMVHLSEQLTVQTSERNRGWREKWICSKATQGRGKKGVSRRVDSCSDTLRWGGGRTWRPASVEGEFWWSGERPRNNSEGSWHLLPGLAPSCSHQAMHLWVLSISWMDTVYRAVHQ